MAVSKLAHLIYQTFCLSLLRLFAVSFCLCTTETTNSRDILLPNIVLLVLHFFRFYLILPIFTPPNLNFFLLLYFLKFNIYIYYFENLRHVHFQFLIGQKHLFYYISRKNHIWLSRKVEHCPTFQKNHIWLIIMLKNTLWF